jgi:toxin ParE1/3/4
LAQDFGARSSLTDFRLAISATAQRDIDSLLTFSRQRFGEVRAEKYEALLFSAFIDIRNDPNRPGVRTDVELQTGIRLYHLRSVLRPQRLVRSPRHWIAFKVRNDQIRVVKVLHESMDLPSYLR